MSCQGIMSSQKASNNPGLYPIEGQNTGLCSLTRERNQFSSQSLSTTKTSPPCHMLVIHPAFYLSSYILPGDPQGWLRSNKLLIRTVSCELVGNFISSYSSMSMDPIQPHSVPGIDLIQCLLALSYKWRCRFSSMKSFQSHLAVTANTNIILLPNIQLNFIATCCSAIQ